VTDREPLPRVLCEWRWVRSIVHVDMSVLRFPRDPGLDLGLALRIRIQILPDAQVANAGTYTVVVTQGTLSTTSNPANLAVSTARLANLSARGFVGQGADVLMEFDLS